MADGQLPVGPIWDDIATLDGRQFKGNVDIIYGGFPCQDLSVAGHGKGLEGKRSGLFFEIVRLAKAVKPSFVFLENVPAIRTRGLDVVLYELAEAGYDCRYSFLSAYDVGAPHKRERWFLLGRRKDPAPHVVDAESLRRSKRRPGAEIRSRGNASPGPGEDVADTIDESGNTGKRETHWIIEPGICRVVNGCPARVDRVKALGNGVVPAQARVAFRRLLGCVNLRTN